MFNQKHIHLILCTGILLGLSRTMVMGQQGTVDPVRMNRDIKIMEGVLSKLLKSQSIGRTHRTTRTGNRSVTVVVPGYSLGSSPKGVYLPDFGILFKLESGYGNTIANDGAFTFIARQRKDLEEELRESRKALVKLQEKMKEQRDKIAGKEENDGENEPVLVENAEAETAGITEPDLLVLNTDSDEQTGETRENAIDSLKSTLILFFSNYASAIGQLAPSNRLAVLVEYPLSWNDGSNPYFLASVNYRDIADFRKKAISRSEFVKRIRFQDQPENGDIGTDIDVMTEIIDRAAQSSGKVYGMSNSGVYIDGLGALFFVSTPSTVFWGGDNTRVRTTTGYDRALNYYFETDPKKARENQETQRKSFAEHFQKFQDNVFDWVSSYGHTLRLKSDEWVIMDVDMGSYNFQWDTESDQPTRFLLQVRKTDLDQYQQGILPLTTLKSRSHIRTF